jgi:hypothetical protein
MRSGAAASALAYSPTGLAVASGMTMTAVPYATISDIEVPISDESKRIEITALAPIIVAF